LFLLHAGDRLYLTADEDSLPRDQWPQMPVSSALIRFTVPFDAALESGWVFSASPSARPDAPPPWKEADPFEAWIDAAGLPGELELRVRQDGDRFQPLGMDGHSQKLSDFFVNAKVPVRARARWPLVCAGDEVVWVPGYRPAERVRVRPETKAILHLQVLPPSSSSD
jgi:tRNA(Ile)-lysidine synthase